MTYQKPEVVPLGLATALIKGGKRTLSEIDLTKHQVPDSELDD